MGLVGVYVSANNDLFDLCGMPPMMTSNLQDLRIVFAFEYAEYRSRAAPTVDAQEKLSTCWPIATVATTTNWSRRPTETRQQK